MSAGVMIANMSWNIANTVCGMVGARPALGVRPTPRNPIQSSPPMRWKWSGPNASEYTNAHHRTPTRAMATKLCMNVLSAFLAWTMPA